MRLALKTGMMKLAFSGFKGIGRHGVHNTSWKDFFIALKTEVSQDFVLNGAAALGFYLMLAIFPAMIFLLSLLPYLPIPDLQGQIMGLLNQALPGEAAKFFTNTVQEVVAQKKEGLLSIGALLTLWAASSGMTAVIGQLNVTYDVEERRPWWKVRLIAIGLTIAAGALVIAAFGLIVAGDNLENWLADNLAWSQPLLIVFSIVRWIAIPVALSLALALIYYFGPDADQEFKFITPGSILGVIMLIIASLGFRLYVENFGNYDATYGSIGAMVVLMLWLYISGIVILLGSELNALIEHFSPEGKNKGEKDEGVPSPKTAPGFGIPVRPTSG